MIDFWPQAILKEDFPQRFLAFWLPKNISLNSDDKKSTEHTEDTERDSSLEILLKILVKIYL